MDPFLDDPDARYLVLESASGEHSLWPSFVDVPRGWRVALPATWRPEAIAFITAKRTDRLFADEPAAAV
ncbi:MbtH family NRPS accessory protein [Amycolatopsis sp. 195334CR]|uniref:MbtH family NRPS accessory protein n=1 Tax=Amycolatopsis sp. 195334CR TaxID=2814588 RepID=UPI001A8E4DBC|nr:MbtH family NRPS accessory protein [Amycolatopsis sp. 195334CR]MBN6040671.1 MbtH family protein [Amycolatopsis sp. 195334CR]